MSMAKESERETITDPEDLPPPAIIPIGGISKESREYLREAEDEEKADEADE